MATSFTSLPIIDVSALATPQLAGADRDALSAQLYDVFSTTGFAYLVNAPLSFDEEELFALAKRFFVLPLERKMKLAKKSFVPTHANTYRGYFPTQPRLAEDNLKEGFEIGSPDASHLGPGSPTIKTNINLSERNVWPSDDMSQFRVRLEQVYGELQTLASKLLSLLAMSLGQDSKSFDSWLVDSLSTLRILHYPPVPPENVKSANDTEVKLSCTPHTDSGILTLLHQDSTGGLEVLNAGGEWIAAPYIPNSVVVNIGDLMASVSGGKFAATMHRVRAPPPRLDAAGSPTGRFSIPFFFEPGEACVVTPVVGDGESVVYGEHIRKKMATWVEFQEDSGYDTGTTEEI
ncbi:putative isopenicillin N synthetase [Aaosphaeria arxii CBS 175.79]|uniref:Putative isopenicillin N synthetase n=1 Tax=Aaosphaeria arxii CBS 175.79 TaxID=1450172 RepID=A0A6A5X9A0_9PLEO|nr:putative isopenicillin N synthetase [Aaosphaeria arxii CBS 175.79]KAF2009479.1 putative isopenicillin N synthetase [Aaosphaeria arxii CBS 175.79]